MNKFQFTPLREGRRPESAELLPPPCDFNSRPSARGDSLETLSISRDKISIHAPPRGATARCLQEDLLEFISIHAPPRGATCLYASIENQFANFNSRPSARGDCEVFLPLYDYIDFNSRPSARGDGGKGFSVQGAVHFNSRPSARGDSGENLNRDLQLISIHAPPRGATVFFSFQHSPV